MTVEDKFAGQTGPCAGCGKPITIPLPEISKPSGAGLGIMAGVGCALVVGCLLLGGVISLLLLPALDIGSGAGGRNSQSKNNMKQIMLALHNYHDVYRSLPPAYVADADGNPLYSWRVLILPFLEQDPLYNAFDKTKAWDDPLNISLSKTMLPVLQSPNDRTLLPEGCSYFALQAPKSVFNGTEKVGFQNILDGTSNTIAIVELKGIDGSWAAPIDPQLASYALAVGPAPGQLNPSTPQGLNVGLCDGSVQVLPVGTAPQTLSLLFQRDDGQAVDYPW